MTMSLFELKDAQGQRYALDGELVRLGRADDNNIVIRDQTISRYHLNFYNREGQLTVENAGSQAGFYLNGNLIRDAAVLNMGDRISIGMRRFEVVSPGGATASPKSESTNARNRIQAGNIPTYESEVRRPNRRLPIYAGLALIVIVGVATQNKDKDKERAPASDNQESLGTGLPTDGFKTETFSQKSITEVQAEARFRESLRDYYNGNFSRALLGFQEALTLSPAHEKASEYVQLAEGRIREQLDTLMKDAERSFLNLQYHRVKNQAGRTLTILSDQVPGYSRRIAQESVSVDSEDSKRPQGQEETLLKIPCDRTRDQALCTRALELIKRSRQKLGEEDMIK